MASLLSCSAWLPALACAQAPSILDMLLYLAPSMALALLMWIGAAAHPAFFVFTAVGTLFHELAHFSAGLLTNAEPIGMSVVPRRIKRPKGGHNWELGSVTFANLRWYNAAPSALAPLLVLLLPLGVAWWRTRGGWQFEPLDLTLTLALAPQFLSFWPSPVDWKLAARSWPWAPLLALLGGAWFFRDALFGLVKA
ncbi:hypothetical protein [Massilia sp.]|uniref:hypothetical protein n=1 Tax=Massilia sp. TaxID=1882437 RepID=UPI002897CA60|nr:hypothetical protein [Massilia sp.]